ncbi:mechanosensitive ion channel protein MscS [Desulfosarcina widdelii]|uniref:Mechanosensitive ion channel protein MscS n=1 Tax=Desulfosarcina widdelii TaxID=947919 RepID=A0A5K7Z2G8_9BACT|nr:mechanosensitive ion channel family protein [Desulfosarcina widdelii]BBO76212.1 mechanosensitive ion channel protein MscS [Desulfosarcina widdelii]
MGSVSTNFSNYVSEISRIGGEFGPMLVKGMILLLIVLILAKYLARFLVPLLVKIGVSDRNAAYSVTGLHILILLIGTILVLSMVGFPGSLLVRVVMVFLMVVLAVYIIAKPYVPQLPFQKGDIIKTAAGSGTVDQMSIINTRLRTFDGKMIYIPNQKIFNDTVTNSSVRPNRRLDIDFFIPYDQDVEKVKAAVGEILQEEEIVLEKPAPRIVIDKFTPDYMEMKARFWVERKHALTGRWGLNEKIKLRFEEEGISMASPRLQVSLPHEEQN